DLYNQEKIEEFNKKIADLEEQKSGLIRANQELFALKGEVDSLEKKIKQNDQFITTYQIYFQFREGIKDFEEKYGNFSKQLLIGPIKREFLNQEGLNKGDIESESRIFSSIEETLHDYFGLYFSQEGYKNLKVDMPGNPAKPLIPFWLGLTSVLVFPIVRNMLLRKYVKGKADDEIEYLLSGCAGMFNGFAGAIFCGLPYCLPALMLSPLILQPFFKLTKFDPIDEMIK
ncbi:MAG: hypothetical protein KKA79_08555, partial [Nanoarchaeota archaeon]|nr:hypothetical protein [Nanoarchaeota archaeon]